jgi:hypothetical protein
MANYRIPRPPWPDEVWREEFDRLTKHVKRWFQEADGSLAPPADHGCRLFANHLFTFARFGDEQPVSQKPVIKFGKPFLKHLASERRVMEISRRLSKICETDTDWRNQNEALLFRIEEVERHLKILVEHFEGHPHQKNDAIRCLAGLAQDLWTETNQGHAPTDDKPNGPLCRLLEPAVIAMGRSLTRRAISKILRGQR